MPAPKSLLEFEVVKVLLLTDAEDLRPVHADYHLGAPLHWSPRTRMASWLGVAVVNDPLAVALLHISKARPPLALASEYA